MESVYLFSVNPDTPPIRTIESGEEVSLVVRGAFADVEDINAIPTPFTPARSMRNPAPAGRDGFREESIRLKRCRVCHS